MNLTDMRALVRRDLRDEGESGYRWTADELDRHIAHATSELSEAQPLEQQALVATTAGSRDISLADLDGLVMVQAVEYPLGYFPRRYQPFSLWAGTLSLLGAELPDGSNACICYGKQHILDAGKSTIPGYLEDLVAAGAEGYAAVAWAVFATNRVNSGGAAPDDFQRLGQLRLDYFHSELKRLGRRHRLRMAQLYKPCESEISRTTDPGP